VSKPPISSNPALLYQKPALSGIVRVPFFFETQKPGDRFPFRVTLLAYTLVRKLIATAAIAHAKH